MFLFTFLFLQDDSPVVREELHQPLAPEIESSQDKTDSTSAKRHTFSNSMYRVTPQSTYMMDQNKESKYMIYQNKA
jgi:hypothetical protein